MPKPKKPAKKPAKKAAKPSAKKKAKRGAPRRATGAARLKKTARRTPRAKAPPALISIDPAMATDFYVATETAHAATYKFWIHRANDQWYPIGPEYTNDDKTDHWIFVPPMPDGSVFAYWLAVYGHANTAWRVRLTVAQKDPTDPKGNWFVRASWIERGVTGDDGNGGGSDALPDIRRVILAA